MLSGWSGEGHSHGKDPRKHGTRSNDYNRSRRPHMNGTAHPGRLLRDAWQTAPIAVPGVFNPLVARMAERLGFRAVYLSGGALSAGNGVPDVGLLTLTEFVDAAKTITSATRLPLLCDA